MISPVVLFTPFKLLPATNEPFNLSPTQYQLVNIETESWANSLIQRIKNSSLPLILEYDRSNRIGTVTNVVLDENNNLSCEIEVEEDEAEEKEEEWVNVDLEDA